jgi:YHS domain-containing protein
LGVSRDGDAEKVWVMSNICILPLFFELDGEDQMIIPLNQVDDSQVGGWIEKKIMEFLDAYLRLETLDSYQAENAATCPVCNMRVNRLHAQAQMEYQGQSYFFCLPACKEKFAADPAKYLSSKR